MAYIANPVNFDGTNDYLTHGPLTGAADSNSWTVSFWARRITLCTPDGSSQRILVTTTAAPRFTVYFESATGKTDMLAVLGRNSGGSTIMYIRSSPIQDFVWHHFAASCNGTTGQIYVDGVSDLNTVQNMSATAIDFLGPANWTFGADQAGADPLSADIADFWFAMGTRIDLSVPANLAEFMSNGAPVDLGADGSVPLGTAPIIYLTGATSTWHTNVGTGGGFMENGAITNGAVPLPVGGPVYAQTKFRLYSNTGSGLGA